MRTRRNRNTAWHVLVCTGLLAAAAAAAVQETKASYASMATLDQYLIPDRQAEISLAHSAAPAQISNHATILVLGSHGYEEASKGDNGFTCLVERSWMSPFDHAEFWNPKVRGPVCYNPPATRSVLPYTITTTELVLSRLPKDQISARIRAMAADKRLPSPEIGAMSYMLSKDGYLGDEAGHWHPHLMFHVPKADAAAWGANVPGSPVQVDDSHHDVPAPTTTFFVVVENWSDGTSATAAHRSP
jgi:hypothetical protein